MYPYLLIMHSLFRWLVVLLMLAATGRSYAGYFGKKPFTSADNALRHWTATAAHVQLLIGMSLYFKSPIVQMYWHARDKGGLPLEVGFFSLVHVLIMLTAIVLLTVGSAVAKRKTMDEKKFKTIAIWFTIALVIMILAIPWPFSPFAQRPYIRLQSA